MCQLDIIILYFFLFKSAFCSLLFSWLVTFSAVCLQFWQLFVVIFTDLGQCPPGKPRSRRNSIDLYTADYNIKLVCDKANESQKMNMMQRSSSHIRIDDIANSKLKLCPRCHSPHCSLDQCTEYGNLLCPRCLQWEHWEDSCPYNDEPNIVSFQRFL